MDEMMSVETMQLTKAVEKGNTVKIITINGFQMMGEIIDFDSNVVLAKVAGRVKMVYRHAISTIEL